ncbi:MAG: hypothetical protein RML72_05460, partial [Bacteroidia bacterium]|nr:hypothetical protein [Bacteroidia bacterium]MDW8158310.1 hypothetical protein [Bacteroidia bacterium]
RATKYAADYQEQEVLPVRSGLSWHKFEFSLKDKLPGEYLIEIYLVEDGKIINEIVQKFFLQWQNSTKVVKNLAQVFELALLTGERQQLSYIRQLEPQEQKQALLNFWKSYEMLSSTPLELFFQRKVTAEKKFSYQNFSSPQKIKYYVFVGPPDSVARFEYEKQVYELWFYQHPYFHVGFYP